MRLLAKTASYSFLHIIVAVSVAYALTGSLMISLGIGLIEPLVQTVVFSIHEWAWERETGSKNKTVSFSHKPHIIEVK